MPPTLPPSSDRARPPPADLLSRALHRLLRPLVRVAIQSGVTFPVLADLLRALYVDVATNDLLSDPRARTDSRVSLLTGVHRKELRRQRAPATSPEPPALTLSSQVIGRWLGTPALTDAGGQPRPLPRLGDAPSFESLVTEITRDIRPRALLDAWLDSGIASLDAEDRVHLQAAAFVPQADRGMQLYYFARNLHDHAAAAAANITAPGDPPCLERSVHYDGLSPAAARAMEAAAREVATAALLEANRRALAIADADTDPNTAPSDRRCRVNLGVYLLTDTDPPADAE